VTICKVFYFERNHLKKEFLISLSNLSTYLELNKDVKELVVTGYNQGDQFVLKVKDGQIVYCNKADVVRTIAEMKDNHKTLHLFEVVMGFSFNIEQTYIYSESMEQAQQSLKEWSSIQTIQSFNYIA
jgi:hypothetical protein